MKKHARLIYVSLIAAGCVCTLVGLYGLILFNFAAGQVGGADGFNAALAAYRASGASAEASVGRGFFFASHKYILLAAGGVCAAVGIVLRAFLKKRGRA